MKRYADAPPLKPGDMIIDRDADHACVARRESDGGVSVFVWYRRSGRLTQWQDRWWASREEGISLTAEGVRAPGRMP